jgi:tetratricopeptide (TPR) repeat protein
MKQFKITLGLLLAAGVFFAHSAALADTDHAAVAQAAGNGDKELRMKAIGKMSEATLAQLDGDKEKLRKALDETIAAYDQLLALNPADTQSLNARAIAKEMQTPGLGKADLDSVVALTSERIGKDAADAAALHDRAVAYRTLRMFEQARADYAAAIKLKPENTWWATELKAMEIEAR